MVGAAQPGHTDTHQDLVRRRRRGRRTFDAQIAWTVQTGRFHRRANVPQSETLCPVAYPVVGRADLPAREPVDESAAQWPDIARQAVRKLPCEPRSRRAAELEVLRAGLRPCRELPRARRAAGVAERRMNDKAAPSCLAHGEREVAIV